MKVFRFLSLTLFPDRMDFCNFENYFKYLINPLRDIWVALPGYSYSSCESSASHCSPFMCLNSTVAACVWDVYVYTCMMHVTTPRGCMNAVRESALKVDCGRKIPCPAGH